MRRVASVLAGVVLLAACADEPAAPTATAPLHPSFGVNAVSGSYIVVLNPDANPRSVAAIAGVNPNHTYDVALKGFSAELNDGQLNALLHNKNVAYIENDQIVSLSLPSANGKPGGGGGNTAQVVPWGIARVGGAGDGTGRTAWIIDTGLDLTNADLNVDAARSRNFTTRGTAADENGHGTHVAGTIAAKNNTINVVGVAAGATVVAVRVLDQRGSGQYSWIIAGVDYVAANGGSGDVANMSLGGGPSTALDNAIKNAASKGVKFALAAGNDGANAANYSPARVNATNVYTISAIASNNCLTSWSNWGNPPVDYAEPGNAILSLARGSGTATMSGTSMASPHAAGLLLLGAIRSGGTACGDPDGNPDTIGVR